MRFRGEWERFMGLSSQMGFMRRYTGVIGERKRQGISLSVIPLDLGLG